MSTTYRCLVCEAELQPGQITFLNEMMVDDLLGQLRALAARLGSQAAGIQVDRAAHEMITDMARHICLACYLLIGRQLLERAIENFEEDPALTIAYVLENQK